MNIKITVSYDNSHEAGIFNVWQENELEKFNLDGPTGLSRSLFMLR